MESRFKIGNFQIEMLPISGFTLKTPLYISHLFLPCFLLVALGYGFTMKEAGIYVFALSLLTIALLYRIWKLFEPINIIIAEPTQKIFTIRSRNLLKRIFFRQTILPFKEIKHFSITEGPEIIRETTRYIITAVDNNSAQIIFTHTDKKKVADQVLALLQKSLENSKSKFE